MSSGEHAGPKFVDSQAKSGHVPVLLDETLRLLHPRSGGRYIDATFGGGGHTTALLQRSDPEGRVLALDADPQAVARGHGLMSRYPERLTVVRGNFEQIAEIGRRSGFEPVDGVLMDLGLSSFQIDEAARGFSFRYAAPLDMRFDPQSGVSAADVVNTWPEADLLRILFEYGEESKSRRIVRAIASTRADAPIETTDQLANLVEKAVGGRRGQAIHPATRTFQALRIAVNRELDVLRAGLLGAIDLLAPAGRLAVISFHSLEDRIVKNVIRDEARDCICPPEVPVCVCDHQARLRVLTSKPVRPSEREVQENPRSRSARLRVAERLA